MRSRQSVPPETTPGNDDGAARTEQEAARHKADNTPKINPAHEKLAQSARETVTALLDLLRSRVATALLELGVPESLALKAADSAAAISHAKSRGSWSIGVTEDSDKAYLAQ